MLFSELMMAEQLSISMNGYPPIMGQLSPIKLKLFNKMLPLCCSVKDSLVRQYAHNWTHLRFTEHKVGSPLEKNHMRVSLNTKDTKTKHRSQKSNT